MAEKRKFAKKYCRYTAMKLDGIDYKDLMNWYEELIQQIKDEKSNIYNNINEKNYNNFNRSNSTRNNNGKCKR